MWLTHIGEIVHEDDLLEQVGRGPVQHRVHSPEEYRPCLVVETDDNWRGRKILQVTTRLLAPVTEHLDDTLFTPNPSTSNRGSGWQCVHTESFHSNRTSGWHSVHTESFHLQQNLWMTMCSHRIIPQQQNLWMTLFTPNPSTSNRTSGWHSVHTESFHQQQNLWMTLFTQNPSTSNRTSGWHCSYRILPPATEPLHDTVFRPNSSTCNKTPVPVGYAMKYGRQVISFWTRRRHFSLLQSFQTGSGTLTASYSMGLEPPSTAVKRPCCKADHWPLSSSEVKNQWSYTSTPSTACMFCTGQSPSRP
jgi:hypothetical protein